MESETVVRVQEDNKLLTKEQVSEEILNCSTKTAEKYWLYRPGFPYVMVGNKKEIPSAGGQ